MTHVHRFQLLYWALAFLILFLSGLPHATIATSLVRNGTFAIAGLALTHLFLPASIAFRAYERTERVAVAAAAVLALTALITVAGNIATFSFLGTPPASMTFSQWTAGGLHFVWVMISWALALEFVVSRQTTAVEEDIRRERARPASLRVSAGRGEHLELPLEEISHVTAAGDYVEVAARDRTWLARGPLKTVVERLGPTGFVQVGRGLVVNRAHVDELLPIGRGRFTLRLRDGTELATSRRSAQAVRAGLLRGEGSS